MAPPLGDAALGDQSAVSAGYWNPAVNTWPNWVGIGVRLTFSAFFFIRGDGFVPMGIYDGISGLALLFTYLPVVKRKA